MNPHARDALEQLLVETAEVLRFRCLVIGRGESDSRRRAEDDARRGGDDGVRRKRDDLGVWVAVLEGSVDELCRRLGGCEGARTGHDDGEGRRVRSQKEEGPFGSNWGHRHPGTYGSGGSQSR